MTLLLVIMLVITAGAVQDEDVLRKQEILNMVIADTIKQNQNLFPRFLRSSTSLNNDRNESSIHTLCSKMDDSDHDRNRVGCCQNSKMRVLYNVKLRRGMFEYVYSSDAKDNNVNQMLPVLNTLRYN